MMNVKDRYFSLNRILLLVVGLWPYKKSTFARIQFVCLFSILIGCIIIQLTIFVTSECSVSILIKVISFLSTYFGLVVQYNSFNINAETMKYLIEQFQHIYENLKDNREIAIIERYGRNAKRLTAAITIIIISGLFIIMIAQLWQDVLHIIFPINQSRSHRLLIAIEYNVEQEKYFYLLSLYTIAAISIGFTAMGATGSLLVASLLYICGMFRIASYRIANSMQIYTLRSINLSVKNNINEDIVYAVDIHRKALTLSKLLAARFEITLLLLILFGIINLTINMFFIIILNENIERRYICGTSAFICILYMFLVNVLGQEITDHNEHVFATAYEVQWHIAPLHVQKLILFLLQHGKKSFYLKAGVLVGSLQCFTTLINTSISYFTVMYSMQQ